MQTANATFILKEPQSKVDTLIFCVIRINRTTRTKYSTNEKINPLQWDKKSLRAIVEGTKTQKDKAKAINLQLNRYFTVFERIETERVKLGLPPTLDYYRQEFDKEFKVKTDVEQSTNLMQFIADFITTCDRKKGSKTAYNTTLKALKDFETPTRKLDFDKITLEFKDQFVNHLKKQNSAKNTIHKHIKNLKVFMENAYQRSLHNNTDYSKKLFRVDTEEVFSIIMSEKDLTTLYQKNIESKKLDRIRDIFILACRTGLRFSDLRHLSINNIIKDGTQLRLTTVKTGDEVVIPLHYQVLAILEKNEGHIPQVPSNAKFNKYLKELGQLVEFNEKIVITKTKGNFTVDTTSEKWELMTAHTARRTFATLAYLAEIPTISIMKLTGHRTEKAFLSYIKIDGQANADLIQDHAFFTGNLKTANEAV